jgi:hypothetical protein
MGVRVAALEDSALSLAISGLKSECEATRQRLEEARQVVAQIEDDLRKLEEALGVLERKGESRRNGHRVELALPGNVRMKDELFRQALLASPKPLKSSEIIHRLFPQLSRSYVYYLIGKLKKTGEILEDEHGRFSLNPVTEGNETNKELTQ